MIKIDINDLTPERIIALKEKKAALTLKKKNEKTGIIKDITVCKLVPNNYVRPVIGISKIEFQAYFTYWLNNNIDILKDNLDYIGEDYAEDTQINCSL